MRSCSHCPRTPFLFIKKSILAICLSLVSGSSYPKIHECTQIIKGYPFQVWEPSYWEDSEASLEPEAPLSPLLSLLRTLWGPFHTYVNYATIFSFVSSKLITHNYNYRSNRRKTRIQPCKKIYKKSGYFLFYLSVTLFWAFLINLVTLKKERTHYITWIFISKHIFWFPATKLINLAPIFPLLSFSICQSHLILCIFSD